MRKVQDKMIGFKSTDKNKSDRVVHRCWYWGSWMLEKHEVRNKIAGAVLLGIFAIGSLLSGCAAKVEHAVEAVTGHGHHQEPTKKAVAEEEEAGVDGRIRCVIFPSPSPS